MKAFVLFTFVFLSQVCLAQEHHQEVQQFINQWHKAAAEANAETYFGMMDDDFVFVGTDSTEVWKKAEFEAFAKPYFDRGKAWDFTAFKRNVYFSNDGRFAWFEESLHTWMGVCRGSGILGKKGNVWKMKHYVLSVTVPNEKIEQFIDLVYEGKPLLKRRN